MRSEVLVRRSPNTWKHAALLTSGLGILALVYIFQRVNLAQFFFGEFDPNVNFIINRTLRLILNDFACFLIILAVFQERKYLKVAFWVFFGELMLVLPVYLAVKLALEGPSEISSPLLSQIHRLIVNPVLMFLLIGGFFYQRYRGK